MCVPVVAALAVVGVALEAVPFEAALAEPAFVGVALEAVPFKAALAEPAFVGFWLLIAH
jgi:ABC-type cobalamin transport system permease subunit